MQEEYLDGPIDEPSDDEASNATQAPSTSEAGSAGPPPGLGPLLEPGPIGEVYEGSGLLATSSSNAPCLKPLTLYPDLGLCSSSGAGNRPGQRGADYRSTGCGWGRGRLVLLHTNDYHTS